MEQRTANTLTLTKSHHQTSSTFHTFDLAAFKNLDCSQSPIFPWDFRDSYASTELPPSLFVRASATWGECQKLPRGHAPQCNLTRPPSVVFDTLPRLRSLLQTKMAAVQSKRTSLENPTEK